MEINSLILFIIYTFGSGYLLSFFLKHQDNFLERLIMTAGIGLASMPAIICLLSLLHLPVDWRIFLLIGLAGLGFFALNLTKGKEKPEIKFTKATLAILIVLLIFAATLAMYVKGAFAYPWLEDDDSWDHAVGVKYVAVEKSIREPVPGGSFLHYMDPYPPGYDGLLGVLQQTSSSLQWSLKFFNALIISLSILFFFFFAREFTGDRTKALIATAALASIPAFMSHFIWALALLIPIFFVALYCLENTRHDRNYIIPAAVAISGILLTQPTSAAKAGIMLGIYWLIKMAAKESHHKYIITALVAGLLLSVPLWWASAFLQNNAVSNIPSTAVSGLSLKWSGTADRFYTPSDFLFAQSQNMINNPVGIGLVISLLALAGFAFAIHTLIKRDSRHIIKPEHAWLAISGLWLVFTLIGVEGAVLPVQFFAFRFWMLLAIPVSLLAAEGVHRIGELTAKAGIPVALFYLLIFGGMITTSAVQKYSVNTAMWMFGATFTDGRPLQEHEINAYIWMKQNLPANTRVLGLCSWESAAHIIGFDMYHCIWCEGGSDWSALMNSSASGIQSFMRQNAYSYAMIDSSCVNYHGINATNQVLTDLLKSGAFTSAVNYPSAFLLKLQ